MSLPGVTPPPLSTDLIDTRAIRFRTSAVTGQPEITPGTLTASAPWLIWFNTNFVTQQSSGGSDVLEAMDTGFGTEAVTALRQAQEALVLSALQPVDLSATAALNSLASLDALQQPVPDASSVIRNLQKELYLLGTPAARSYGVISGTHTTRALTPAGGVNLNRIYFETDRSAVYVSINNIWTFAAGIMVDLAANRPVDLGTSDVNFFFLASDTLLFSYWTGVAWVDVPNGASVTTGAFMPEINFGGGSTGIAYSGQSGHYAAVENLVTLTVDITLSAKGTSTGIAEIVTLPFSPAALEVTLGAVQYMDNMLLLTSTPTVLPEVGSAKASLFHFGATGAVNLNDTNFTNTSRIIASMTYYH